MTIMDWIKQRLSETTFSTAHLVTALLGSWAIYLVGLCIYRGKSTQSTNAYWCYELTNNGAVFLSPLAAFPGPKLAAITTWYQAYYDIWLHGQFFKKLDRLHEEYGNPLRSQDRFASC